jgi:hypothetical protein
MEMGRTPTRNVEDAVVEVVGGVEAVELDVEGLGDGLTVKDEGSVVVGSVDTNGEGNTGEVGGPGLDGQAVVELPGSAWEGALQTQTCSPVYRALATQPH